MPRSRRPLVGCITLASLILAAEPASAEWFADLYVGGGFTPSTDVSVATESIPMDDVSLPGLPVAIDLPSVPLRLDLDDVGTDDFVAFGVRLGRWFEAVPDVGLALDVFHFAPEIRAQRVRATAAADLGAVIDDLPIDVVPGVSGPVRLPDIELSATAVVSFDVMLRRPLLRSPEFPHGRLQPYIGVGPALLFTDPKPDVTLGVKVSGGLAWQFHPRFALFGEYRFTHFRPEVEVEGVSIRPLETRDLKIEADVDTHYVLAGLSLRF